MRGFALGVLSLATVGLMQAPVFAQAWETKHQWNERARPGDLSSGSYAYEYGFDAVAASTSFVAMGDKAKYDCADLSITLLVNYAAKYNLPFSMKTAGGETITNRDPRFKTPKQLADYARGYTNARTVALSNTVPIEAADQRSGDMFLMRWNQLEYNPFPGRDVWHTYVIGSPRELLFYGNDDSDSKPLPVTATMETRRLNDVGDEGKAIYEGKPRRWKLLQGNIVPPPKPLVETTTPFAPVDAKATKGVNLRTLPSTKGSIVRVAKVGETFTLEGKTADGWLRLRLPNNQLVFASGSYFELNKVEPRISIVGYVPSTPGITGVIGNANNGGSP